MNEPREVAPARFSARAEDYAAARPHYPPALVDALIAMGFPVLGLVVDLGSGTGISALPFVNAGYRVIGIEPSAVMRRMAERMFAGREGFETREAWADATGLRGGVADAMIAGQAFHWFPMEETRREALRVLRPGAPFVAFWNVREVENPFDSAYEELLARFCPRYEGLAARYANRAVAETFFAPGWQSIRLPNPERIDRGRFFSRLRSASYVPLEGEPGQDALFDAMGSLFDAHAVAGSISFSLVTEAHLGKPAEEG